jgi:RNA polymerase sigma factor FliA
MAQLEAKLGRAAKDKEIAASLGLSKDEFEYWLLKISRASVATLDERWISSSRIEWAIIDELRSMDWAPRSMRARVNEIERTSAQLEAKLARAPTDEELAASLGISEDELQSSLREISTAFIAARDELRSRSPLGGVSASHTELRDIDKAISRLPKEESLVFLVSYYESRPLSMTEPRLARLYTKAILRLNACLSASRPDVNQD